jgi:hypothetical protein
MSVLYFVGYTYKTSVLERSSRERSGDERERKTGKEKNRENGGLLQVKTLNALLKMLMRSPSPGGNHVMSLTKPFLGGNTDISGFLGIFRS